MLKYSLKQIMQFILFLRSIDDSNGNTELEVLSEMTGCLGIDDNYCSLNDAEDFDFESIPLKNLYSIKMPFINQNRKIFCNGKDFDLIDLFQPGKNDLKETFINKGNIIEAKCIFIRKISEGLSANTIELIKEDPTNSKEELDLVDKAAIISNSLSYRTSSLGSDIYNFFVALENYFNIDSKIDLLTLFSKIKSSIFLKNLIDMNINTGVSIDSIKNSIIFSLYYIHESIINAKSVILSHCHATKNDAPISCVSNILLEHLHLK